MNLNRSIYLVLGTGTFVSTGLVLLLTESFGVNLFQSILLTIVVCLVFALLVLLFRFSRVVKRSGAHDSEGHEYAEKLVRVVPEKKV